MQLQLKANLEIARFVQPNLSSPLVDQLCDWVTELQLIKSKNFCEQNSANSEEYTGSTRREIYFRSCLHNTPVRQPKMFCVVQIKNKGAGVLSYINI